MKMGESIIVCDKEEWYDNGDEWIDPYKGSNWGHNYMYYRKLNDATRNDHYHVAFIDKMLDRLSRQEY